MKGQIVPLTKEEMDKLIEQSMDNDFFYTLFIVAKTTGRRLGEFYGVQDKQEIGRRVIGKKKVYDIKGNQIVIPRTISVYKKLEGWNYGLKVKDRLQNSEAILANATPSVLADSTNLVNEYQVV